MADAGEIKIQLIADSAQFNAAMDAAKAKIASVVPTASTASAAINRLASGQRISAEAANRLKAAQQDVASILAAVGGKIDENNAAYGIYQQAVAKVAAAQQALVASSTEASAALEATGASARTAAGGLNRSNYMLAYGTAYAGSYAAGLRGAGFIIGRVAAMSERMGPILARLFPAAVAGLIIEQVGRVIAEYQKWYEATILLKRANDALIQANISLRSQIETARLAQLQQLATQARMNGNTARLIELLKEMEPLEPVSLKLKLDQKKVLDPLERAGFHVRTLINELQEASHLGDLQSRAAEVTAAIQQTEAWIKKTQQAIADLDKQAQSGALIGGAGFVSRQGGAVAPGVAAGQAAELQKQMVAAKQLLGVLQQVKSFTDIKGATAVTKLGNDVKTASDKASAAAQKAFHKVSAVGEGSSAELARVLLRQGDQYAVAITTIHDADQKAADAKRRLDKVLGQQADHQAKLNRLIADYPTAVEKSKTVTDQLAVILSGMPGMSPVKPGAAPVDQKAIDKLQQDVFGGFNKGLSRTVEAVQLGTERMSVAWRRLGANMLLGMEETWANLILRDVEGWAVKLAVQASGQTASQALADAHDSVAKLKDAKAAARGAFKSVMHSGIPFPVDFVIAAGAAGAAFSAVMAFAKGGVVPQSGMAMVHQHEMVLPANIAQHVMSTAGRGGAAATVNVNVSALDGADAHAVFRRNREVVVSTVRHALRSRNLTQ